MNERNLGVINAEILRELTAYLHAAEYEFETKQVVQRRNMPPAVDVVLKSVCLGTFFCLEYSPQA